MSNGKKPFMNMGRVPLSKVQAFTQSQNPYDLASMFGLGGGSTSSIQARRLNQLDQQIANLQNFRRQSGPNLSSLIDLQLAESRRDAIEDDIRSSFIDKAKKEAGKLAYKEAKAFEQDFITKQTKWFENMYGPEVSTDPKTVSYISQLAKVYSNSPEMRLNPIKFGAEIAEKMTNFAEDIFRGVPRKDVSIATDNLRVIATGAVKDRFIKEAYENEYSLPEYLKESNLFLSDLKKYLKNKTPDMDSEDWRKLTSQSGLMRLFRNSSIMGGYLQDVISRETDRLGWDLRKATSTQTSQVALATSAIFGEFAPVAGWEDSKGRDAKRERLRKTLLNSSKEQKNWGDWLTTSGFKEHAIENLIRISNKSYAPQSIVNIFEKIDNLKTTKVDELVKDPNHNAKSFENASLAYDEFLRLSPADEVTGLYARAKNETQYTRLFEVISKTIKDEYDHIIKAQGAKSDLSIGIDIFTGETINEEDQKNLVEYYKSQKNIKLNALKDAYEKLKGSPYIPQTSSGKSFDVNAIPTINTETVKSTKRIEEIPKSLSEFIGLVSAGGADTSQTYLKVIQSDPDNKNKRFGDMEVLYKQYGAIDDKLFNSDSSPDKSNYRKHLLNKMISVWWKANRDNYDFNDARNGLLEILNKHGGGTDYTGFIKSLDSRNSFAGYLDSLLKDTEDREFKLYGGVRTGGFFETLGAWWDSWGASAKTVRQHDPSAEAHLTAQRRGQEQSEREISARQNRDVRTTFAKVLDFIRLPRNKSQTEWQEEARRKKSNIDMSGLKSKK